MVPGASMHQYALNIHTLAMLLCFYIAIVAIIRLLSFVVVVVIAVHGEETPRFDLPPPWSSHAGGSSRSGICSRLCTST